MTEEEYKISKVAYGALLNFCFDEKYFRDRFQKFMKEDCEIIIPDEWFVYIINDQTYEVAKNQGVYE